MPSCFWASATVAWLTSSASVGLHLPCQFEAIRIHVGDDDVPRAGVTHDRRGHDADRAGAGDQHVLAQHGKRQRGMHGVAQRIENRGHVVRHRRIEMPDVRHRQREILGERAGPIHADALRFLAEVTAAGQAVSASPANDVPFAADDVVDAEILDVASHGDDPADELMAHDQRHGNGPLRPGVPVVDMDVGAADARAENLDQHVVDPDFRNRHLIEPKALAGFLLHQRFHRLHSGILPGQSGKKHKW